MSVNSMQTVRDVVIATPGAIPVFEKLGIDYCCGGARTLADACSVSNISLDHVVTRLESAKHAVDAGDKVRHWETESLTALAAHIIDTHHFFTKQELIRLERLITRVLSRHGAKHPELESLSGMFRLLKQDLVPHIIKEERALFPFIARMEEAVSERRAVPRAFFGTVLTPLRVMTEEHEAAGLLLSGMRRLLNEYVPPPDACLAYHTLLKSLQVFEADLHQHIHLENNILFPRAIEVEARAEIIWDSDEQKAGNHHLFGH